MSSEDWYRRETWTAEDEQRFETKLSRSHGQRSEYLRIEAWTLARSSEPAVARPAIRLAARYLHENPEGIFRAGVFLTIAAASATLGDYDAALKAHREALEAERRRPNVHELAHLHLAWFVATHNLDAVFDEVLTVLDATLEDDDLVLPFWRYRYFAAVAVISSARGNATRAAEMARQAIQAAEVERGPFWRHPTLGVACVDDTLSRRLAELAG
jgi:tetratricopeptide (TPR) repeat protein